MRILALHGFTGSGVDFAPLRAHLPSGWQWHCPDLPGHGANAGAWHKGQCSFAHHLDFISRQEQEIPGPASRSLVLVGYSMGGRLALHWAMQNPAAIAALILISASPGIHDRGECLQRRQDDAKLALSIRRGGVANFLFAWKYNPLFVGLEKNLTEADLNALLERRLRSNRHAGLAASLLGVGTGMLPSLWEKLPTFQLPTLCIAGEMDQKFASIVQKMADALPNGKAVSIPDTWHCPHLEKPALLASTLHTWLRTVIPAASEG